MFSWGAYAPPTPLPARSRGPRAPLRSRGSLAVARSLVILTSESDEGIQAGAGDAADDRGDDGDPAVLPVRRSLAGNRQDRVGDAPTKIARGGDLVARRSPDREADAEDEHADQQRLQAAAEDEREIDVPGLGQRLRVRGDRQDAEHQDRRADDFADAVGGGAADRGPRGEHGQLRGR